MPFSKIEALDYSGNALEKHTKNDV